MANTNPSRRLRSRLAIRGHYACYGLAGNGKRLAWFRY